MLERRVGDRRTNGRIRHRIDRGGRVAGLAAPSKLLLVIGGQLDVRSTIGRGTEVELRVPGRDAYLGAAHTSHWWEAFRRERAPAENVDRQGIDT